MDKQQLMDIFKIEPYQEENLYEGPYVYTWQNYKEDYTSETALILFRAKVLCSALKIVKEFLPEMPKCKSIDQFQDDLFKEKSLIKLYRDFVIKDNFNKNDYNEITISAKQSAIRWDNSYLLNTHHAPKEAYIYQKEELGIEKQAKLLLKCRGLEMKLSDELIHTAQVTKVVNIPFISLYRTINPLEFSAEQILKQEIVEYLKL